MLFVILICVALFAGLAYAVTQSTRSGGGDASRETTQITTAQVSQILSTVTMGLQRFLISNGYSIEQASMHKPEQTAANAGININCNNDSCNLHSPSGGNVPVPILPREAASTTTSLDCSAYILPDGRIKPFYMATSVLGVGTELPDIVIYYCGVSEDVCEQINVKYGIRQIADSPVIVSSGTGSVGYNLWLHFPTIPSSTPNQVGGVGAVDSRVSGKHTFCSELQKIGASYNELYHVIHPR